MDQKQMFYSEHRKIADLNKAMLEALYVENPITDAELSALIKKRPHVYGRFSGFIGKRKQGV